MAITIRTVLISGLFVILICLAAGDAEAARRRAILGGHAHVAYGAAYRMATPVMTPATPRAMRRVVRYGRSDFVGPRGYSAVVSPWPLIPVTTPAKPYGVGVVPPGRVIAWQSPAGYFYRANYQSDVMRSGPAMVYPQQPGVEVVPPGTLELPPEPIPAPPAESGPQL